jgi:hypothetical protein
MLARTWKARSLLLCRSALLRYCYLNLVDLIQGFPLLFQFGPQGVDRAAKAEQHLGRLRSLHLTDAQWIHYSK